MFVHIVYKVTENMCCFHCTVSTMVWENKAQRIHAGLSAKQTLTEVSLWRMNISTLEPRFHLGTTHAHRSDTYVITIGVSGGIL